MQFNDKIEKFVEGRINDKLNKDHLNKYLYNTNHKIAIFYAKRNSVTALKYINEKYSNDKWEQNIHVVSYFTANSIYNKSDLDLMLEKVKEGYNVFLFLGIKEKNEKKEEKRCISINRFYDINKNDIGNNKKDNKYIRYTSNLFYINFKINDFDGKAEFDRLYPIKKKIYINEQRERFEIEQYVNDNPDFFDIKVTSDEKKNIDYNYDLCLQNEINNNLSCKEKISYVIGLKYEDYFEQNSKELIGIQAFRNNLSSQFGIDFYIKNNIYIDTKTKISNKPLDFYNPLSCSLYSFKIYILYNYLYNTDIYLHFYTSFEFKQNYYFFRLQDYCCYLNIKILVNLCENDLKNHIYNGHKLIDIIDDIIEIESKNNDIIFMKDKKVYFLEPDKFNIKKENFQKQFTNE